MHRIRPIGLLHTFLFCPLSKGDEGTLSDSWRGLGRGENYPHKPSPNLLNHFTSIPAFLRQGGRSKQALRAAFGSP
jgi:hypothetical protein